MSRAPARGQQRRREVHFEQMQPLKAQVKNGRLILNEPTNLPEGHVVDLVPIDEGDDLDDEERAALHRSLERSVEQYKAGQFVDGDAVLGKLGARG